MFVHKKVMWGYKICGRDFGTSSLGKFSKH